MKKGIIALIIGAILLGGAVLTVVGIGLWGMGVYNKAIELENQFSALTKASETNFDAMWKILSEKAGVTKEAATQFRSIYSDIMENRYGDKEKRGADGSLMLWVTEQNPNFDMSMYKDLSQSIEALRTDFRKTQDRMTDVKRVHDDLRRKFPGNIVFMVMGLKELELKLVTSTRTEEAFKTGKDDKVGLFNEK